MVSQVDLSLRAPSSVVSRSSRHRRPGRSHAGGGSSSFIPQNEFPVFSHTGDVEILVAPREGAGYTKRYLLHRIILTQCSGFFEASTSAEWSKATVEGSSNGGALARIGEDGRSEVGEGRRRWRYELDSGTGEGDVPMLVQKEASPASTSTSMFGSNPPAIRSKPPSSNPSFFRSVASLSLTHTTNTQAQAPALSASSQQIIDDYDNLFRIFYNYPPALDSIDIATAYLQCKSLLTLADLYDALAVVGPRIDHHLLQFQSRLWKQIAKYPSSYLKLGYMAQSKSIFAEALIHVVGAWPMGERHLRHQMPGSVLEVIEDKVDELDELVGRVEGKLFRLSLTTNRSERVSPYNDHLGSLVMNLWRQWLADSLTPPPPPLVPILRDNHSRGQHSRNVTVNITQRTSSITSQAQHQQPSSNTNTHANIGRVFRMLDSQPANYLGHEECKKFLKLSPEHYNRENLRKFERRLEELRGMARGLVAPLMRSELLGDAGGVSYLVCTRVGERDFPWTG